MRKKLQRNRRILGKYLNHKNQIKFPTKLTRLQIIHLRKKLLLKRKKIHERCLNRNNMIKSLINNKNLEKKRLYQLILWESLLQIKRKITGRYSSLNQMCLTQMMIRLKQRLMCLKMYHRRRNLIRYRICHQNKSFTLRLHLKLLKSQRL